MRADLDGVQKRPLIPASWVGVGVCVTILVALTAGLGAWTLSLAVAHDDEAHDPPATAQMQPVAPALTAPAAGQSAPLIPVSPSAASSLPVLPPEVASAGTSVESLRALYREFAADVRSLRARVGAWANETDLHQGIHDLEAEIMYLRLRKLRPKRVAEFGFGQGLATAYILHALEDNGGEGHLYTFDLKDQWGRKGKVPLQHRWTLTIGDAARTMGKFSPYQYVHSDCEHSTAFAKHVARWLQAQRRAEGASILCSFHDVYKWYEPGSPEVACEHMKRSTTGITPEGEVMLKAARAPGKGAHHPPQGTFSVAPSHFPREFAAVQEARHGIGLDDNWVADTRKYRDPKLFKKKWAKSGNAGVDTTCIELNLRRPLNPTIFWAI